MTDNLKPCAATILTDEQIGAVYRKTFPVGPYLITSDVYKFGRAVERKVTAALARSGSRAAPADCDGGAGLTHKSSETRMDSAVDAGAGVDSPGTQAERQGENSN